MAKLDDLIGKVFELRNAAHRRHWATTGPGSYAEHKALGELYDALPDRLDDFVECYQGCFGLSVKEKEVDEQIKDLLVYLDENGPALVKETSHLQNVIDEISTELSRTYYKLRSLK